jgi:hypothetical protein
VAALSTESEPDMGAHTLQHGKDITCNLNYIPVTAAAAPH